MGGATIAVLYEVVSGADIVELHGAIEHATTSWPGTPLIACRDTIAATRCRVGAVLTELL